MKDGQRSFLQNIETLIDGGVIGEQTDRQLLQLFADRDPMAAELAFTVLVRRHGPMVFGRAVRFYAIRTRPRMRSRRPSLSWPARLEDFGSAVRWDHGSYRSRIVSPTAPAPTRPDRQPMSGRPPSGRRPPLLIQGGMIATPSSMRN
jgi:hypothetical protein